MDQHYDSLAGLNQNLPLNEKLKIVHEALRKRNPFIERLSVALYDSRTAVVRTFLASSGRDYPLEYYEVSIDEAPSLKQIMTSGNPRILNDLSVLKPALKEHTKNIVEQGYQSSYTVPLFLNQLFFGFLFYDSYESGTFGKQVLADLDPYSHLIANMVGFELISIRSLLSALRVSAEMVRSGGEGSSTHIDRVAQYSRLIAKQLSESGKHLFTDEEIEKISLFSSVHELSKTVVPLDVINSMIENLGVQPFEGLNILEAIATHHYDRMSNSETEGKEVPIEALIVTTAHLFDAMTLQGHYEHGWSNEEAFSMLRRLARTKSDLECIKALEQNMDKVQDIQASIMES